MSSSRRKKPSATAPPAPLDPEPEIVEIVEILIWEGIKIDVHYRSMYCGCPHLELHVIDPPLAPIPVSETGYRSHFDSRLPEQLEEMGGVLAFAKAWLDASAKSVAWKKRVVVGEQLSLF